MGHMAIDKGHVLNLNGDQLGHFHCKIGHFCMSQCEVIPRTPSFTLNSSLLEVWLKHQPVVLNPCPPHPEVPSNPLANGSDYNYLSQNIKEGLHVGFVHCYHRV